MDAPNFIDHDLWGSLQPLGAGIYRMDFLRFFTLITIGRHPQTNHFVLPGQRISKYLYERTSWFYFDCEPAYF